MQNKEFNYAVTYGCLKASVSTKKEGIKEGIKVQNKIFSKIYKAHIYSSY